jgi:transcriptional regulator with XRE-family HTH domain
MASFSSKKILGERLKELRIGLGISQEELADRCGLHRTYVGSVERGERNLSLENIVKIARALRTTPSHFLDGIQ